MAAERIIGVDFGTSTSVVRVKRYENGKPANERLAAKSVVFNMGSSMVPTLIRDTGSDSSYGYSAEVPKKGSTLYQSFKVLLESSDPEEKNRARALTAAFMRYLAKTYREQSDGGHLGNPSDEEKTIISYPVKWSDESKQFMIEAAKAAGFANVSGMDEADAAITAVLLQNEELLKKRGYLKANVPLNILLLDMGAGTTDLVLCRHTPGQVGKTEILCTYPKAGDILFGGREVDALLGRYIIEKVPDEFRAAVQKKLGQENYKAWKETMVSPALEKAETVTEFSALDTLADLLGFDVEIQLDRAAFEAKAKPYMEGLPRLINGCLNEAQTDGSAIDLVILTGGHSQWYFVKEIVAGTNKAFGDCGLTKIEADNNRIISIALPQETVALGLVFSKMQVAAIEPEPIPGPIPEPKPSPNPKPCPNPEPIQPSADFKMVIKDVFTISGRGTVVTGTVENGSIKVGDTAEIVCPGKKEIAAVVLGIENKRKLVQEAIPGEDVGLLLANVSKDEIASGGILRKRAEKIIDNEYMLNNCLKRLNKDLRHDIFENLYNKDELPVEKVRQFMESFPSLRFEDILYFHDNKDLIYRNFVVAKDKLYYQINQMSDEIPVSMLKFKVIRDWTPWKFVCSVWFCDNTGNILALTQGDHRRLSRAMNEIQQDLFTLQQCLVNLQQLEAEKRT